MPTRDVLEFCTPQVGTAASQVADFPNLTSYHVGPLDSSLTVRLAGVQRNFVGLGRA